jgi:hypothetical protein
MLHDNPCRLGCRYATILWRVDRMLVGYRRASSADDRQ